MNYLIPVSLLVGAVIHLLPVSGVLGNERLSKLYGLSTADPNSEILLRHRAVLFGLLSLLLTLAAFKASFQPIALAAGIASTTSFLVFARLVGGYNSQLSRVVVADIIALIALIIGAAAHVLRGGA